MPAPKLTTAEQAAAKAAGMSPEKYAALRGGCSLADYEALRATEREDAERERLKAAVREALDEKDAA